jgi:hypothetical protein
VNGVSGDINYDLGAEIGEKLEEYAEEPVWYGTKILVVFVRESVTKNAALHEATDTLHRSMCLAPYLPGGMVCWNTSWSLQGENPFA